MSSFPPDDHVFLRSETEAAAGQRSDGRSRQERQHYRRDDHEGLTYFLLPHLDLYLE